MNNMRTNAWLLYQYFIRANKTTVSGNIIAQDFEEIFGTYDVRQLQLMIRCLKTEKWLTEIGNYAPIRLRTFKVEPNGKLLSPVEKIELKLKELKEREGEKT